MRKVITWLMLWSSLPLIGYAVFAMVTGWPNGLTAFMTGLVLFVWGLVRDTWDHRHPMTRAQRARGYFWGNQ